MILEVMGVGESFENEFVKEVENRAFEEHGCLRGRERKKNQVN